MGKNKTFLVGQTKPLAKSSENMICLVHFFQSVTKSLFGMFGFPEDHLGHLMCIDAMRPETRAMIIQHPPGGTNETPSRHRFSDCPIGWLRGVCLPIQQQVNDDSVYTKPALLFYQKDPKEQYWFKTSHPRY